MCPEEGNIKHNQCLITLPLKFLNAVHGTLYKRNMNSCIFVTAGPHKCKAIGRKNSAAKVLILNNDNR